MKSGLNLIKEQQERDLEQDWIFGSQSPNCIYAVPVHLRDQYLPFGELQYGRDDFQDCATRDPLNQLETKFNYAYRNNFIKAENKNWLVDNGYIVFHDGVPYVEFSDRFNAIKSGTTEAGNSMKAPRESIRKDGLIPKIMLPANSKMRFDDYHNAKDITKDMEKLGREFLKRWAINYEQYTFSDLKTVLERDLVGLAGHAWPKPKNGVYPRTNAEISHAFMGFGFPLIRIFDNYLDKHDGDWIKQLAPNFRFYEYGYRTFIRDEKTSAEFESLIEKALRLVKEILEGMMPPKSYDVPPKDLPMNQDNMETKTVSLNQPITLREELYNVAKNWLGKDASPKNFAPSDLACAESVSTLISLVIPFPVITGTWSLMAYLDHSKKFKKISLNELQKGDVLLYATGTVKNAKFPGHVFIVGETHLMSNNSKNGQWEAHYTLASAKKRWEIEGGFKPHCYTLI